ncbi:uncharacterized mitochondrial protein AtMg00820-like [Phaseolus vulgaris]|uniref:uncharacterized mitochondrial protein AtMg00820-like n=1 Tax=Phaseolus vulgaris TaxID=3885 RepID=UPI0035C9AA37
MNKELVALKVNQTWIIINLSLGKSIIGCHWVYKVKYKSDDTVKRYKARLVAKGYTQLEEPDFSNTFALVAKLTTSRLILSIVVVYFDDIILIGNDLEENSHITNLLDQYFHIKYLGDLNYFLGLARNNNGIHISDSEYLKIDIRWSVRVFTKY